jgi:membrane fusion protein
MAKLQTEKASIPSGAASEVVHHNGVSAHGQPLFRSEVLVEHQSQWLGAVLLEPKITHWMFASVALLATAAVLGMLFLTSYTRKARVNGWLVPQQGLMRVFAPQAGVITRIHVKEGMEVKKGTPLVTISTEMRSTAFGNTQQEIVRRLTKRRDSMAEERAVQERLFSQQTANLVQRTAALDNEQKFLAKEIDLQHTQLQLNEQIEQRMRTLRNRDIVTEPRREEAERERIQQAAKLQGLERTQAALRREHMQMQASLRELPLKRFTDLAEAEARREIVIVAPQDGMVTSLQIESGGSAQPSVPLLNVVPSGGTLQAQLFSPSRAIGFLREGQRVLLRYEAFPYQKFGFHEGVVSLVSRSAIGPAEMTQQLAGLSALYGSNEPIYRITVDLKQQTVTAYGTPMSLQPGMKLEADVLLESRRLVEWMLEPLFSISGKLAG